MRRAYNVCSKSFQKDYITTSGTITVPSGAKMMDIFLIGGGGGGGYWRTWGYTYGLGGCGGKCTTVLNLPVTNTSTITCTIGNGGEGGRQKAGSQGGTTSLVLNGITYSAQGGAGGASSISESSKGGRAESEYWLVTNNGVNQWINDKFYNGSVMYVLGNMGKNLITAANGNNYTTDRTQAPINTSTDLNIGVPEFFDESLPRHAFPAISNADNFFKGYMSYQNYIHNSDDGFYVYNGGGYGGGGYSGYYRYNVGGTGGNGAIVIRWYK